jgi:parallel beta-helix repeat protein
VSEDSAINSPDPRLGVQRRSSQVAAVGVVLLLLVSILWLTYGFSNSVYSVGSYRAVPRAHYIPSLPPEVLALTGQPALSTIKDPLPASRSVRAIAVLPGTIEVRQGGNVVRSIPRRFSMHATLSEVATALGDSRWMEKTTPGTFVLRSALIFRRGVGLDVASGATTLHFVKGESRFLAIDGPGVSMIDHLTVDVLGAPARWEGPRVQRPFVIFDSAAQVHVVGSRFLGLGWDSNGTLGVTFNDGASGSIRNSTMDGNFIGLYTQYCSGLRFVNNVVANSHVYGIDPHTSSSHLLIKNNRAVGNQAHGIILSTGVTRSRVEGNRVARNHENGIVMDNHSSSNAIVGNRIDHNDGDGITLTDSPNTTITGNWIEHNRIGILNVRSNPIVALTGNTVEHNHQSINSASYDPARNTIDTAATGHVMVPPGRWTWVIVWVLWPLVALIFLAAFLWRRFEYLAGWRLNQDRVGIEGARAPLAWGKLRQGYRQSLAHRDDRWVAEHPVTLSVPLPFVGPPVVPEVAPRLSPEEMAIASGLDEAGTPPGDRRFRPDIQGLRALAVALVVLYHAHVPWVTGGYVGVDVFFVVSGFVITGLLLRERTDTKSTSMLGFYARRARRILPAATLVIVATVVASYYWLGFIRGDQVASDGRWASVFLANLHLILVGSDYFAATSAISPLQHYWSLAVEEQFYIVFPALFALTALRSRSNVLRQRLTIVFTLVIVASLALSVVQTKTSPLVAYYSPFTRSWELAIGGLIAVSGPLLRKLPMGVAAIATWLGLVGILVSAFAYSSSTSYPGIALALPVLATALVIAAGLDAPRLGAELVLGRWLGLRLGAISYSLYLWHFPVLVIAAEAATTPLPAVQRFWLVMLAVALSIITHVLVENPVRHSRALSPRGSLSIATGGALIAGSLLVSTLYLNQHTNSPVRASGGSRSVTLTALQAEIAQGARLSQTPASLTPPLGQRELQNSTPNPLAAPCSGVSLSTTSVPVCVIGDVAADRTMVLYGDSQAEMWSGAFDAVARRTHWRLEILIKDGCPPWLGTYLTPDFSPFAACTAWHQFAVKRINAVRPQLVVITGGIGATGQANDDRVPAQRLLRALAPSGARLAMMTNTPYFAADWTGAVPPTCLAQHASSLRECDLPVATWMRGYGAFRRLLVSVATAGGANLINVDPLVCTHATCPVVVGGFQVYRDSYHIFNSYGTHVSRGLEAVMGRGLLDPRQ